MPPPPPLPLARTPDEEASAAPVIRTAAAIAVRTLRVGLIERLLLGWFRATIALGCPTLERRSSFRRDPSHRNAHSFGRRYSASLPRGRSMVLEQNGLK